MTELEEILNQNQTVFSGPLYTIKKKEYPPWKPSGFEGRYSGNGTSAYYFGDNPTTCWRERQNENADANPDDYELFSLMINNGTFVDVGAVAGTQFVQPKNNGGWQPTQELSNCLDNQNVLGFRYASQPSVQHGYSGTCFCIYQSSRELSEDDFQKLDIHKSLEILEKEKPR